MFGLTAVAVLLPSYTAPVSIDDDREATPMIESASDACAVSDADPWQPDGLDDAVLTDLPSWEPDVAVTIVAFVARYVAPARTDDRLSVAPKTSPPHAA